MRKIRSLYSPHDFHFFLDTPFIKEHKLEKWFSDLCTELQKKGGAKYLIINQKRGETPRWAI